MRATPKVRNLSRREAIFQSKAQARVIASGDWLTWPELNALLPAVAEQRSDGAPDRYLDGAIFSINYEGVEYFPRFAIEARTLAIAAQGMQRVIAVLATRVNGWGMALWFESSNSYLGGKLPKDFISSEPDAVVQAAQEEIDGVSHG
ncbi:MULTISPECIES: hypothetical protein [Pseudomonas]|uniref:DUF2384 domain-containing protein n=2 Tax=Pseudomonas TaxID=286 RepID=B1J7Z8_PSEPW|nr:MULTISPECIES: hypothetical protein [Pseudomonas]MBP2082941.1 hypothetical protein [Pseudomonas sp. PvP089]MBP2091356.1 hypothetical protein [Pseudomonas sp. PvP088]MBP2222481.1 hypothetical protein [Pseudomonas putida]MDZ4021512.1 hypothetical protein [Pseudomonas sichuanensis]PMY79395.1 hypothetical protein C1X72_20275 [Pseudomonas sp. FW306-2-2C-D06B]